MRDKLVGSLLGVGLLLLATSAFAQPTAGGATLAEILALDPAEVPLLFAVPEGQQAGGLPGPSQQSVCVAECWDGTSRTCFGTSCRAYDSTCNPQRTGYCYGSSTGYKFCPSHTCGCSAQANCGGGVTRSCTGTSECFAIDGCYAYCDGGFSWCPNPPICPIP